MPPLGPDQVNVLLSNCVENKSTHFGISGPTVGPDFGADGGIGDRRLHM
jgi:hypothetical protein